MISDFATAAARRVILIPPMPVIGKLSQCGTEDKPNGKNGRYLLFLDARPAGGFMNMADGEPWSNWVSPDTPIEPI